jgi:hypothetical protein
MQSKAYPFRACYITGRLCYIFHTLQTLCPLVLPYLGQCSLRMLMVLKLLDKGSLHLYSSVLIDIARSNEKKLLPWCRLKLYGEGFSVTTRKTSCVSFSINFTFTELDCSYADADCSIR